MMNYSTGMKWITAIAEGFLAIPIIGGAFVISYRLFGAWRHVCITCDYVMLSIRDMQGRQHRS